jgi:hypothetical protein
MSCTTTQRRLLSAERPDRPAPEVRDHLDGCAECREIQRRLLDMEQRLGRLPVPESQGRTAFVLQFLSGPVPARQPPPMLRLKEGGRRKLAMAFALAAGLAVCALGMWAWTSRAPEDGGQTPKALALALRHDQLRQRLATAQTPGERVRRLRDLADEVLREARANRGDAGRVDEAARFYAQVIRDHLLAHARALPAAEQKALLPDVAEQLRRAESEATRLAVEADSQNRITGASFREIAAAAGDGHLRLLALSRGEAA